MRFPRSLLRSATASTAILVSLFLSAVLSPAAAQQAAAQPAPSAQQNQTSVPAAAAPTASPDQVNNTDGSIAVRISQNVSASFYPASLTNLTRTYVKLTGVDLNDNNLIDQFAAINYCDLYTSHFNDEFTWRQAREAIRKTIQRDLETYPEYFYVDGTVAFGRYNFETKAFDLEENSKFRRVGLISVHFGRDTSCATPNYFTTIPTYYKFRLTNPITMDTMPISETVAYQITRMMEESGNRRRLINVTFFMRVNDFSNTSGTGGIIAGSTVRATLLSMRFYLDQDHKAMIYEYKPTN